MKEIVLKDSFKSKYPFFDDFVEAMDSIKAPEKVTDEYDFKILFLFFKLYVLSCQSLKSRNIQLSKENIKKEMSNAFDFIRNEGVSKYIEDSDHLPQIIAPKPNYS